MTDTRKADASDELIELRARVEALEAQQRLVWRQLNTETVYGSEPAVDTVQLHTCSVEAAVKDSLTTQPRGLVDRVADGICESLDYSDTPQGWEIESRAAILAVAGWLRQRGITLTAQLLENEVDLG